MGEIKTNGRSVLVFCTCKHFKKLKFFGIKMFAYYLAMERQFYFSLNDGLTRVAQYTVITLAGVLFL